VILLALCSAATTWCAEERIDPLRRDVVTTPATDADTDASSTQDAEPREDVAAVDDRPSPVADAGPQCRPNNDMVLDRAELSYALGTQVLYAVNDDNVVVSNIQTLGMDTGMGIVWNFASMVPTDHRVLDEVQSPTGKWWSGFYPTASFTLAIDRANTLQGVYRFTNEALQLLATVSREAGRTNVAFSPAIDTIRFPLRMGSAWQSSNMGNGVFNGVGTSTINNYRFMVDQQGTVYTPAARFSVLRLRMELDQTVTGTIIRRTQRSYLYLAECWGLVARVVSVDNEMATEFTRASEYRRLGL
jgi:hypothetical protein